MAPPGRAGASRPAEALSAAASPPVGALSASAVSASAASERGADASTITRERAPGPSAPSTTMSAPSRAWCNESTSRDSTAPMASTPLLEERAARNGRDGADRQGHQHLVASGDRGRLVHQRLIRPRRWRVGIEHGVLADVSSDRTAVVGETRLDPLQAVHVRSFPGQRREHPGPGRNTAILITGTEQSEAVTPHHQDGGGGAGPGIDGHAEFAGALLGPGPEGHTHHGQPIEQPGPMARSPSRSSAGSPPSAPADGFGPDVRRAGAVTSRVHCGAVPRPRPGSHLASATGGGGPHPPGGQGQPLLPGTALNGPEGQGHPGTQAHDGQHHPDHGGPGADGQHPDDQPGGHRGDLAAAPAGDHPPTLEWGEAVADPGTGPAVRSHRSPHRRHARGPRGPAAGTASSSAVPPSTDLPSPTG